MGSEALPADSEAYPAGFTTLPVDFQTLLAGSKPDSEPLPAENLT